MDDGAVRALIRDHVNKELSRLDGMVVSVVDTVTDLKTLVGSSFDALKNDLAEIKSLGTGKHGT